MDNVTSFAFGVVIGVLASALYSLIVEVGESDRTWLEQERMREKDDRGRT